MIKKANLKATTIEFDVESMTPQDIVLGTLKISLEMIADSETLNDLTVFINQRCRPITLDEKMGIKRETAVGIAPGSILKERAKHFKKKSSEAESEDEKNAIRELIEVRISEGMKPKKIADETGVTVQTVYNVKNKMKVEGRLHIQKKIDKDIEMDIVAMAIDHKNAIEISNELSLPLEDVQAIIKNNL